MNFSDLKIKIDSMRGEREVHTSFVVFGSSRELKIFQKESKKNQTELKSTIEPSTMRFEWLIQIRF